MKIKSAVVLNAGLCTRFDDINFKKAKALLPVFGKPYLYYIINLLEKNKIERIIITVNKDNFYFVKKTLTNFPKKMDIIYSVENERLETAGSLANIKIDLDNQFLVVGSSFYLPQFTLTDYEKFSESIDKKVVVYVKNIDNKCEIANYDVIMSSGRKNILVKRPHNYGYGMIHTTYQIFTKRLVDEIPRNLRISIPEFIKNNDIPISIIEYKGNLYHLIDKSSTLLMKSEDFYVLEK